MRGNWSLRREGGTIVWIVSTYGPGAERDWTTFFNFIITGEASDRFRLAFQEGKPEHTLWRELDRRPEALLASKNRLTPFADPIQELERSLRSRDSSDRLRAWLLLPAANSIIGQCHHWLPRVPSAA